MLATQTINGMVSFPGAGSLMGSICKLAAELRDLKQRLRQAQGEIARLSAELRKGKGCTVSPVEVQALRRGVAFYCHPDRGGDGELMSRLNRLFDLLEQPEAKGA